jgi:ribonuclease T2
MCRGRRSPRRLAAFLGVTLLVLAGCDQQPQSDSAPAQAAAVEAGKSIPLGKGFDFYVLSLSWSPSYCEAEGENANRQQCASGRPYAFVVHGLWPQFERGFPEDCGTGGQDVDNDTARSLYDLMPSAGLIRHEWRKHGTCSGLSQADYFKVLRFARERVMVPQEFRRLDDYRTLSPGEAEQSFVEANPGLDASDIAISCDRRFLREVRICMTKDLQFRGCPEIDRRACRARKVVMPPMRGG